MTSRSNLMDLYQEFVEAAERKDLGKLTSLIRDHPGIHNLSGDAGGLLLILHYELPSFIPTALALGLHPDAGPPSPHHTLLQMAICDGDVDFVKLCLRYGASLERRNCEEETALGYAATWAPLEIVQALLEAGAEVNTIEGGCEEAFSTALDATFGANTQFDRPEIRELLRSHGAKRYHELCPKPS